MAAEPDPGRIRRRSASAGGTRPLRRVARLAVVAGLVVPPVAVAQEPGGIDPALWPEIRDGPAERTDPAPGDRPPPVDVEARFEAFQRDFAREFGGEVPGEEREDVEEVAVRFAEGLAERFEGSAVYRWYERASALYERMEILYERLEGVTRWTTSGFRFDANPEALVDGGFDLRVARKVHGFDVGMDVRDPDDPRVGFRVGGEIRGYRIGVDVADLAGGRLSFRVDKRWD